MEKEETEIQIIKLEEMRDELTHAATILEDELKHYQKINEKYNINRE